MKLKSLGEFNLINRIASRVKVSKDVIKGIGDDTAVLKYTKDKYLLYTCDMLLEGRHFLSKIDGHLVGKKSLSVNISDIAAMGGVPKFAIISLGIPSSMNVSYVDDIYKGILSVAKNFNVDIVGGDTISSDKIIINISLLGEVEKRFLVLRSGARQGDEIFITGAIGGSLKGKHLSFIPHLKQARFLVRNFRINSMIDISDGLLADLGHILRLSKKGALLYKKDMPISRHADSFNSAIKDGEDFGLIFTLSEKETDRLQKKWPFKTRLSRIGKIVKDRGLYIIENSGRRNRIESKGYTHF